MSASTTIPSTRDRIEKAVDALVNASDSFTLLDVSEAVKADGHGWLSHSAMRKDIEDVLRDSFSTKNRYQYYTVSSIIVQTPVGPTDARLFHPLSADPNAYTTRAKKASAPGKVAAPVAPAPAPVQISSGHPTVTGRSVKKDRQQQCQGYIEVPRAIWQKAGMVAGSQVLIDIHPGSITVFHVHKKSKYAKNVFGKVAAGGIVEVVPNAERFRISPKHLQAAGLNGVVLDFSAFTDKFVVSRKV